MRAYINRKGLRDYIIYTLALLPMAMLCYKQQLTLGPISSYPLFLILLLMPIASNIEIPITKIRTRKNQHMHRDALLLEETYGVPVVNELTTGTNLIYDTKITLNVGGFIIPILTILYLFFSEMGFVALEIMLIVLVVVALLADFVDGVGIVIPSYVGIFTIPLALILAPQNAATIIFIAGTGGIIAGTVASLMALKREEKGSAYIDIGGAACFQAIYITALLAALISGFIP
ncbi:hypothetical protein BHR79_09130 [Methanohalophilus halophilus]|uniref:DUF1614 domain-containing protein n=3 Tax=Methanohalophilus halophilus TaxID=2177 RepID=A0A1L3Q427_9EURY|nr:hypothetical protein BHR79_09130 [Methanohalophilus halophilus]RNI09037.1 DUF1614 domain-containing protein [Methanohalophilus halophilus]SDW33558.1 Uncharacterized membrane protein [Methanohalophilus halophilus]